jgi:hypothetical protein
VHEPDRDVGAAHDELTVRHVDHAHHAEHDGEARSGKDQEREDIRELIQD